MSRPRRPEDSEYVHASEDSKAKTRAEDPAKLRTAAETALGPTGSRAGSSKPHASSDPVFEAFCSPASKDATGARAASATAKHREVSRVSSPHAGPSASKASTVSPDATWFADASASVSALDRPEARRFATSPSAEVVPTTKSSVSSSSSTSKPRVESAKEHRSTTGPSSLGPSSAVRDAERDSRSTTASRRKESDAETKERSSEERTASKDEIREAILKRRKEITDCLRAIKLSNQVDMCFMLDCTGSMSPWIQAVKDSIDYMVDHIQKEFPNVKLRVAFVRYTDFDMGDTRTTALDFTSDLNDFKRFVGMINANGGGDGPEDVMGGFSAAFQLKWFPEGTHIMIHIADYPPHGRIFQTRDMGDDYPDGRGITHQKAMADTAALSIQYNFGYIVKEHTDLMCSLFDEELQKVSQGQLRVNQFDARQPNQLQFEMARTLEASICQSMALKSRMAVSDLGESKNPMRSYVIKKVDPNWSDPDHYFTVTVKDTKYLLPDSVDEISKPEFCLKERTITTELKFCKWAFAEGAIRVVYRGQDKHGKEVVIKMPRKLGKGINSKKHYLLDMETQTISESFLRVFLQDVAAKGAVLPITKLKFVLAKVIQIKGDKPFYAAMEPFVAGGNFVKFNSNCGFRSDDPQFEYMQAFSHWTWKRSGGYTLICDLQGFVFIDQVLLTDPALHSKNLLRGSKTNLGADGMRLFFETHVCGATCNTLGLKIGDFLEMTTSRSKK